MYSFTKSVRKAEHVRRYTIEPTTSGWEVREERDSQTVRRAFYQDWHRVERARRSFTIQLMTLQQHGWDEVV